MPTRNVVLTGRQARLVERLVRSGRYQNASEVLRDGLRLIERQDRKEAAKLRALRDAVKVGLADVAAGRVRAFASGASLSRHVETIAAAVVRRSRAAHRGS